MNALENSFTESVPSDVVISYIRLYKKVGHTKKRFIQMKQINHVKLGNIRKLLSLPFIFALFAAFTFQPGKSQVVKVTKSVTTSVMDNGEWKSETVKTTSTYNNGELQGETVE